MSLVAHGSGGPRMGSGDETLLPIHRGGSFDVAHALRADGFDASEDGTGRGTPIVPIDLRQASRGEKITNHREHGSGGAPGHGVGDVGDPAFTVSERGQAIAGPIAFDNKASGRSGFGVGEISPTLRSMNSAKNHPNAGGQVAVAFDMRGREGGSQFEGPHETANIRAASGGSSRSYVAETWAVRRLTPLECERLQGFPDDYTRIPMPKRGKKVGAVWAADGPRYKALGNSMAVNVMRWIGRRIDLVRALVEEAA